MGPAETRFTCLGQVIKKYMKYCQTPNISHTLVNNKLVDHSDACRHCSNYIFILDLTPGFNGLNKDNCKTKRETFKVFGFGAPYTRGLTVVTDIQSYVRLHIHHYHIIVLECDDSSKTIFKLPDHLTGIILGMGLALHTSLIDWAQIENDP